MGMIILYFLSELRQKMTVRKTDKTTVHSVRQSFAEIAIMMRAKDHANLTRGSVLFELLMIIHLLNRKIFLKSGNCFVGIGL